MVSPRVERKLRSLADDEDLRLSGWPGTGVVLLFAAVIVSGCASAGLDVEDFYQSVYAPRYLRPAEQVLFYDKWVFNPDGYVVVTDERVFYWENSTRSSCKGGGLFVSVDHAEIREIAMPGAYLVLTLFDGRKVPVCGGWIYKKVGALIQSRVDCINGIRAELGLSMPQSMSTEEIGTINEPVMAELRARRRETGGGLPFQGMSRWCRSPDGRLYAHILDCPDGWRKVNVRTVPELRCTQPETGRTFRVDASKCPDGWRIQSGEPDDKGGY